MGDWYTVGLALGLGVAGGAVAGVLIEDWEELAGGALGGLIGAAAAAVVVAGALRRGGTRGGLALIVAAVAAGIAVLALVPVLGYVEAAVLPALAVRLRRTQPERYAGLRTLARD